jgi:hypothetical protein
MQQLGWMISSGRWNKTGVWRGARANCSRRETEAVQVDTLLTGENEPGGGPETVQVVFVDGY